VKRPLPLTNLSPGLAGSRLIQLSDLHIGRQVDDDYLIHTFQRIQELTPEFVVYTGDFMSYQGDHLAHLRRLFGYLPLGRVATVGVLGNHDYGPGWSRAEIAGGIAELAATAGVQILRNEVADVAGLQIVGLDELWAHRFHPEQILPYLDKERAALVLSHNPDTADQPGWGAYQSWILCGHTHGGQCKPPFLPAPLLPVRNRRYCAGEYGLSNGRRMYINRGLGHLLQVRFNARPEVTVFTLQPG
jgi:predicted MPP superfamily phosphohydrolase